MSLPTAAVPASLPQSLYQGFVTLIPRGNPMSRPWIAWAKSKKGMRSATAVGCEFVPVFLRQHLPHCLAVLQGMYQLSPILSSKAASPSHCHLRRVSSVQKAPLMEETVLPRRLGQQLGSYSLLTSGGRREGGLQERGQTPRRRRAGAPAGQDGEGGSE